MMPSIANTPIGRLFAQRRRSGKSRLYRRRSPIKMRLIPPISVMIGSILTGMTLWPGEPVVPPLGFMIFLAWRLLQPGLWPMWAGFPLGLADDLVSGQPVGSAALLWSLAMLAIDYVDHRVPWRDWSRDLLFAWALLFAYIAGSAVLVTLLHHPVHPHILLPQFVLAILLQPLLTRGGAGLDRWRLSA